MKLASELATRSALELSQRSTLLDALWACLSLRGAGNGLPTFRTTEFDDAVGLLLHYVLAQVLDEVSTNGRTIMILPGAQSPDTRRSCLPTAAVQILAGCAAALGRCFTFTISHSSSSIVRALAWCRARSLCDPHWHVAAEDNAQ